MGPVVRRSVVVRGRVQGVGFRAFTRRVAAAEGLAVWVENRPDGTVAASAEGPEDAVARWIAALHEGPRLARVDAVEEG